MLPSRNSRGRPVLDGLQWHAKAAGSHAYSVLAGQGKIYLMEEPENGMHPMAIETVYQSLSSVYDSQVLVTTHSPVLLSCAPPKEILCFAKDKNGATEIIRGHLHPRLADWRSSADTTLLFASEVFG